MQPYHPYGLSCNMLNLDLKFGKLNFKKFNDFTDISYTNQNQFIKHYSMHFAKNQSSFQLKTPLIDLKSENDDICAIIHLYKDISTKYKFTVHKEGLLLSAKYDDFFPALGVIQTKLMVLLHEKPSIECAVDLPIGSATFLYKYDSFHIASRFFLHPFGRYNFETFVGCNIAENPVPAFFSVSYAPLFRNNGKICLQFKYDGEEQYRIFSFEDFKLNIKNRNVFCFSLRCIYVMYGEAHHLLATFGKDLPISYTFFGNATGVNNIVSMKCTNNLTLGVTQVRDNVANFYNFSIQYGFNAEPNRLSLIDVWKYFRMKKEQK